ncbi:zinc transport system substrate-binding protein [Gracilibacillus orientalis]|uniref:Zinc transport system substrate-binding protein n=1 Tax=Gracilibacillus orientalis TaxID=334253 RepID=A0A1I4GY11_9BACI|nr:zinc ABC transporter substrate-binding protein [Gracilibacillus orientalis]SFL34845.1 zinc transport system substrate-binding protein [Gracilibacillus orientalis]
MKKVSLAILSIFFLLIGCNAEEDTQANQQESEHDTLQIYATLYPLAYFTEEIGGESVEVETILPPGSDPHNFEPTSKMMVDIAEANMFLYNGANLETYAGTIEEALVDEDVLMVEAADGVSLEEHVHEHEEEHAHEEEEHAHEEEEHAHEEEHDHDHGDADPHLWLDPIRSIDLARNIKDALIELNPEQQEVFETNFSDLEDRLIALDDEFHEQLETAANNEILVTHAAYGYWEQSYGIEQIALAGLSSSEEPSQKELERILDHVEDTNIQYLLFEQNVEPKVAEVIQAETNVESLDLHNLSILTEEDIENKETYFSLMERNLEVLAKALDY